MCACLSDSLVQKFVLCISVLGYVQEIEVCIAGTKLVPKLLCHFASWVLPLTEKSGY